MAAKEIRQEPQAVATNSCGVEKHLTLARLSADGATRTASSCYELLRSWYASTVE